MLMPPFRVSVDWLVQASRVWKTRPVCDLCGEALHVGEMVQWRRRRRGVNHFPDGLQVRHTACEDPVRCAQPVGKEARVDVSA